MKKSALCAVSWCVSNRVRRQPYCAVHLVNPQYDPGPSKGSLKKVWDRVPVEPKDDDENADQP